MQIEDLLEPNKVYETQLSKVHHENAIEWFDELTEKSQVNIEENKVTCDKYYKEKDFISKINKEIGKLKVGKFFAIVMLILGIIAAVAGVLILIFGQDLFGAGTPTQYIVGGILTPVGLAMFIGAIFIIKHVNKLIKNQEEIKRKAEERAEKLLATAWAQMNPLNDLFDYNMGGMLVKKSAPLLQFDPIFDVKKYQYLVEKFGFTPNTDKNISTVDCLTGSILGNPFIFEREYEMRMEQQTYSNSITIYWTTYSYDSNGNQVSHQHSQVLTASVTKPKPNYYSSTWLIYGNQEAPDLRFSRRPSDINKYKDQTAINKYVKNHERDLQKMAEKALGKGKSFTSLGNTEFELFFNALNRDNEVQFRLLFTPLAQKSMLDLMKDPHPFGDDFTFIKDKKLNLIHSRHMQGADIFTAPKYFMGFDYAKMKENFINYHDKFLANVFFDLAPLLCIPSYQTVKDVSYIYPDAYESNVSCYEHEVMANKFDERLLVHKNTKTPAIIKTNLVNKIGDMDNVRITAHSFDRIERVTVITKLGNDGNYHDIPVTWYEYPPLVNYSSMAIRQYDASLKAMKEELHNNSNLSSFISNNSKNNGIIFQRGLFSFLTKTTLTMEDNNALKNIMKK